MINFWAACQSRVAVQPHMSAGAAECPPLFKRIQEDIMKKVIEVCPYCASGCKINLLVENGKVVPKLKDIFQLVKDHDAVLATAHVSPEEASKAVRYSFSLS